MSEEIDMKAYAGEVTDSAAEGQYVLDENLGKVHEEAVGNAQHQPVQQVQESSEQPSRQDLNFRALSSEVERIKAERDNERREYQLQLELMRANMQRPVEQPVQQQPKRMFDGMEGNDVPTIEQVRNAWSEKESEYQNRLTNYESNIQEMQVALQNPDYADVVRNYAAPLIKNDPILAQGAHGAENKAMYVYRLGKMAQQMEQLKNQAPQVNQNAQKMVENARKPGSLASAGGQSALSKADYISSMSDNEFMKFASKHLEGI